MLKKPPLPKLLNVDICRDIKDKTMNDKINHLIALFIRSKTLRCAPVAESIWSASLKKMYSIILRLEK